MTKFRSRTTIFERTLLETGVQQKITVDSPVVTTEKRNSMSAKGNANTMQKRQDNMDRMGMGGRGFRTVQHATQMKTIEQVSFLDF